jgi:hypothetical protein
MVETETRAEAQTERFANRLQARFAGGFVLENEPTGEGFKGWFH